MIICIPVWTEGQFSWAVQHKLMPSSAGPGHICTVPFPCPGWSDPEMVPANASEWAQEPSSPQPSGKAEVPYVCIWPHRLFLWYGTGCAGISVQHSLWWMQPEKSSKGSFSFRGKGSQLSHFPPIPLGHCGALTGSLGCTTNWFPVCSQIILGIILVRGDAVHSKVTGSVAWC